MRRSACLALLLTTSLACAAPAAVKIDGKTPEQWIELLRTDNREQWNNAANALMMNGDRAEGPLTVALTDRDARVRRGAARGLRQLNTFHSRTLETLRKCLDDPDLAVRAEAVETLLHARDYEAPLPAALLSVLNSPDEELRQRQGYVLMILPLERPGYLAVAMEALRNPDPEVRSDAAGALRYEREVKADAAPALRALLTDPVLSVRLEAASSYWHLTGEAPPLLDLLGQALASAPEADDRTRAARITGVMGPQAAKLSAALTTAALDDPEAEVRKAAAESLPQLGLAPEVALSVYVKLLQDRRQDGWQGALEGLVGIGPAAVPALTELLPQLLLALKGEHIFSQVPRLAAEAAGLIGPPAHSALPLLVRLANLPYQRPEDQWQEEKLPSRPRTQGPGLIVSSPPKPQKEPDPFSMSCNSETQRAALAALARVGTLPEALPHLLRALENKDAEMVMTAATALASFGPAAKAAVVPLVHAIVTQNDKVYYMDLNKSLFFGLIAIDPKALPGNLLKIAQKRPNALSDLQWIAPQLPNPDDYLAPLVTILQQPVAEQAKSNAASALAALGGNSPEAAQALGKLLGAKDPRLQMTAAEALKAMGPTARPALPYLLTSLKSADEFTRFSAVDIVGAVGPGAASCAPRLLELARDPTLEPLERGTAAWAYKAVGGDPAQLVDPMVALLGEARTASPGGVAELLGEIGPPAAMAVPALRKRLADSKPYSRVQTVRALWQLTGEVTELLPPLTEVARGELCPAKVKAILLLGELKPATESTIATLRGLVSDKSPTVRMAAALSLASLTGDSSAVAPAIVAGLRDPSPELIDEMMLMPLLQPALTPFADQLVGPLTQALARETEEAARLELIVFLPLLGPAAKASEPELEKLVARGAEENPGAAAQQSLLRIRGRVHLPDTSTLTRFFGDDMPWRFPVPD